MPAPTGRRSSTSARRARTARCRGTSCWDVPPRSPTPCVRPASAPGDRVVGYLPNIPEAIIAFLATASRRRGLERLRSGLLGEGRAGPARAARARWSLVTADGYRFGGKTQTSATTSPRCVRDCRRCRPRAGIGRSRRAQPIATLETVAGRLRPPAVDPVLVGHHRPAQGHRARPRRRRAGAPQSRCACSRTSGPTTRFFWYTSPSWMMWNFQVAGPAGRRDDRLLRRQPVAPRPDTLWELAAEHRGRPCSAPAPVRAGLREGGRRCRAETTTCRRCARSGSPARRCRPSSSLWLRDHVGEHVLVASISGGTDVVSAFIGGVPHGAGVAGRAVGAVPGCRAGCVGRGRQAGASARSASWSITKPMPSMPVGFWNDPDGSRYREAYFEMYPGVWRHGDWITITDHGSVIVHGRSDSTLNRHGIRMGSADIYQAVERLPEVAEALVIGAEQPDGGYWMPLFVVLADGAELDRRAARPHQRRDPRRGLAAARARRDHRRSRYSAHPHRQEARGADQEAVPGRRRREGRGAQRSRRPGAVGLVRHSASKVRCRRRVGLRRC